MLNWNHRPASLLLAFAIAAATNGVLWAQSGSRNAPARRPTAQGSTFKVETSRAVTLKLGLEGYCPVCVVDMKKWVGGKREYHAIYDGTVYYFPGQEQKDMFVRDRAKYAIRPVASGQ